MFESAHVPTPEEFAQAAWLGLVVVGCPETVGSRCLNKGSLPTLTILAPDLRKFKMVAGCSLVGRYLSMA